MNKDDFEGKDGSRVSAPADPSEKGKQRKGKWTKEALLYAFGLLDNKKTIAEAIQETTARFGLAPVSHQYLSKVYRDQRGKQRKTGHNEDSPRPSEPTIPNLPTLASGDFYKDRDTFFKALVEYITMAVTTVDIERSARTGETVKIKRYLAEALKGFELLGRAAGFLNESTGVQLTKIDVLAQVKEKPLADLFEQFVPFQIDHAAKVLTLEELNKNWKPPQLPEEAPN